MASILGILKRLTESGVEFVLVGGMAATAHGSSMVTEDVDVCIRFDRGTIERMLAALRGLNPLQRMHPDRAPLSVNPATYEGWRNLYVLTDAGQIDFLGEVTGVGGFDEVVRGAIAVDLGGFSCRVMGLEDLIQAKRALGRPKDMRVAAELEFLRDRLRERH